MRKDFKEVEDHKVRMTGEVKLQQENLSKILEEG